MVYAVDTLSGGNRLRQQPSDVAVVIVTRLDKTIVRTIRSIFAQRFAGSIQILLGVDAPVAEPMVLAPLASDCPGHCSVHVVDFGYSTSARSGGMHPGATCGALRTILSYAAHSRRIAYLDEGNWWAENHLETLCRVLAGRDWAFSLRWYVDKQTGEPLRVDQWEAVGPDEGVFKSRFGGFVDANCLLIDKLACEPVLRWWSIPLPGDSKARSEDRNVFHFLREQYRWAGTGQATSYVVIDPEDGMHRQRLDWIGQKRREGRGREGEKVRKGDA